jgi:cytochrome c oxidase assembly protein subunit 15
MTDWKFAGGLPPLTVEQWQMEFLKYQNSPEYKRCVEDRKMMVMKKKKTFPVAMCFFCFHDCCSNKKHLCLLTMDVGLCRVNKGMSLDQFKFIYWMEYAHRMWGRALGVVFAGPFAYFLVRGYITKRLALRLSTLMTMGATQGLVGWWMVKSGLEVRDSQSHLCMSTF